VNGAAQSIGCLAALISILSLTIMNSTMSKGGSPRPIAIRVTAWEPGWSARAAGGKMRHAVPRVFDGVGDGVRCRKPPSSSLRPLTANAEAEGEPKQLDESRQGPRPESLAQIAGAVTRGDSAGN
jgi:hypothetical protein